MASLRELLEKQKADAAKPILQNLAKVEVAPPTPPHVQETAKKPSFLNRMAAAPKPTEAPQAQPAIQTAPVAKAQVTIVGAPEPEPAALSGETVEDLKRNLEFLANNIEQKELVGQVVRTIAVQLKENPQFSSSMTNADFDLLVRGLRRAYNVAARKKIEKSETKTARSAEKSELEQMMKDAGINLNF